MKLALDLSVSGHAVRSGSLEKKLAQIVLLGAPRAQPFWVGFAFTVGAQPLIVTALQRLKLAGNSLSHEMRILSAGGIVASGTVNLAIPSVGAYATVAITPVTLSASTTYVICSNETLGENWSDASTINLFGATGANAAYSAGAPANVAAFTQAVSGHGYAGVNAILQ